MKLNHLRPMIEVASMDETLGFYRSVLGFTSVNRIDGFERPLFTGSFDFKCEDRDAWWDSLKDKAPVVYPIENFHDLMREFAIRDNNGYCLQFGNEIKDRFEIPPPDED